MAKVDSQVRTGQQLKAIIAAHDRKKHKGGTTGLILRRWDQKAGGYVQLRDDEPLVPGSDGILHIGLQRARPALSSCNAPPSQQQPQHQVSAPSPLGMAASSSAAPPPPQQPAGGHMAGTKRPADAGRPDAAPAVANHAAKRARGPAPPMKQEASAAMPRQAPAAAERKPAPPSFSSTSSAPDSKPPPRLGRSESGSSTTQRRAGGFFHRQSDILDLPLINMGPPVPLHERSTLPATVDELLRVSSML